MSIMEHASPRLMIADMVALIASLDGTGEPLAQAVHELLDGFGLFAPRPFEGQRQAHDDHAHLVR